MKIFSKTHFWKEHRTFLDIEAKEPFKERGYAKEGTILLKIGEQSTVKNAFKLSVDEARALRDSIDMFLRFHDMKLSELMTEHKSQFEKVPDMYPRAEENVEKPKETNNEPFFMFSDNNTEEKTEEQRKRSEFYF